MVSPAFAVPLPQAVAAGSQVQQQRRCTSRPSGVIQVRCSVSSLLVVDDAAAHGTPPGSRALAVPRSRTSTRSTRRCRHPPGRPGSPGVPRQATGGTAIRGDCPAGIGAGAPRRRAVTTSSTSPSTTAPPRRSRPAAGTCRPRVSKAVRHRSTDADEAPRPPAAAPAGRRADRRRGRRLSPSSSTAARPARPPGGAAELGRPGQEASLVVHRCQGARSRSRPSPADPQRPCEPFSRAVQPVSRGLPGSRRVRACQPGVCHHGEVPPGQPGVRPGVPVVAPCRRPASPSRSVVQAARTTSSRRCRRGPRLGRLGRGLRPGPRAEVAQRVSRP